MNGTDSVTFRPRPDLFSRGTLELTFRALRKSRPALALIIQNLLVKDFTGRNGYSIAELPLKPETVTTIIRALQQLCDAPNHRNLDTDRVLIQSLLLDWSLCFNYLLSDEQAPRSAGNDDETDFKALPKH